MNQDDENALPKKHKTVVKVVKLTEEENQQMIEYYYEQQRHDEASALGAAYKKGRAEIRAEIIQRMRENGATEEQLKMFLGDMYIQI